MNGDSSTTWDDLERASSDERPTVFVDYARTVIDQQARGDLTISEAAYTICGAIQFDELTDQPRLSDALEICCDLELPPQHRAYRGADEARWQQVKRAIEDHAAGRSRDILPMMEVTAVQRNTQGAVTQSMIGRVVRKFGRTLILPRSGELHEHLQRALKTLNLDADTPEYMIALAAQLDRKRMGEWELTARAVEHTAESDHARSHSRYAFCGSAGPAEIDHLMTLIEELSDEELITLADRVDLRIAAETKPQREDYEGIIDEADREDFYREYTAILEARA